MRERCGEDLHSRWELANRYSHLDANNNLNDIAIHHSNADQDYRIANISGGDTLSYANSTDAAFNLMAVLANSRSDWTDARDCLRQHSGSASDGFTTAGRNAGTNIKKKQHQLIPG